MIIAQRLDLVSPDITQFGSFALCPINSVVHTRTSTVYLNECGTIDRKKDQLEPFRRLFQDLYRPDNTSENNPPIRLVTERKPEIRNAMLAGFRAINSRSNSSPEATSLLPSPTFADPYKNNLRLVQVATLDAYLSNAQSLGLDIPNYTAMATYRRFITLDHLLLTISAAW
jgi:hypothetical protein